MVAVSAVQSSTGEVAALDEIAAAARAPRRADRGRRHARDRLAAARRVALRRGGVRVLQVADVPARHGVPGARRGAGRADDAAPGRLVRRRRPADAISSARRCGSPDTARRFDTSPAWFSWVGTEPALKLLNEIGVETIHAHDLELANRFRAGLGLRAGGLGDRHDRRPGRAREKLARAGIMAAARAGRLRASFHLYNTEADVDAAPGGAGWLSPRSP